MTLPASTRSLASCACVTTRPAVDSCDVAVTTSRLATLGTPDLAHALGHGELHRAAGVDLARRRVLGQDGAGGLVGRLLLRGRHGETERPPGWRWRWRSAGRRPTGRSTWPLPLLNVSLTWPPLSTWLAGRRVLGVDDADGDGEVLLRVLHRREALGHDLALGLVDGLVGEVEQRDLLGRPGRRPSACSTG